MHSLHRVEVPSLYLGTLRITAFDLGGECLWKVGRRRRSPTSGCCIFSLGPFVRVILRNRSGQLSVFREIHNTRSITFGRANHRALLGLDIRKIFFLREGLVPSIAVLLFLLFLNALLMSKVGFCLREHLVLHLEHGSTARGGAAVSQRRVDFEDLQASLNAENDEISAIGYARPNEIDRKNQDSGWA